MIPLCVACDVPWKDIYHDDPEPCDLCTVYGPCEFCADQYVHTCDTD